MSVGLLTEKPSAARNFAKALGGAKGDFEGTQYVITAARGHLYELADPAEMVPASKAASYSSWSLEALPWDEKDFAWKRKMKPGASSTISTIGKALGSCTEIVIATDVDPSGEGDLLAWEILDELGLHGKKITRMYFTDEAPESLRKAFRNRKSLASMADHGAFRKADFRTKFDLLTMQFTRIATLAAAQRAVLRQGRLKSSMVGLVGAQLKAHEEYVRKPFYQARFRDDNGVVYTDPDQARFDAQADVPLAQLASSAVVLDSKADKSVAPRRLLDLAGLSSRLASRGMKADAVLATYQKMYEAQVVSYPRTEDKTITGEQFKELAPLVDQIAAVVGVDTSILTHRSPRRTHVKDTGAHGANRPGPKVPASLAEVKSQFGSVAPAIYEELARSFLAMFAEDYVYEAQQGHVADFPSFVGSVAVPKSRGWKDVFDEDSTDEADDSGSGLGSKADPFAFEGANKRPEHPSMKWLMKQLEKRDVGTGATRTSTYSEVTNDKAKYPLLRESRGKLTMTDYGQMSFRILDGTRIGDLSVTEHVYAQMREIEEGTQDADTALAVVAEWVREDLETMQRNAVQMRKDMGLSEAKPMKEKYEGVWAKTGTMVKFSREWCGVRFTDEQCEALLRGEKVGSDNFVSKRTGNTFSTDGQLNELSFPSEDGKTINFVGFEPNFGPKKDAAGNELVPDSWCKRKFTDEEKEKLQAGEKVFCEGFTSKAGKSFDATVSFSKEKGSKNKRIVPHFD